MVGRDQTPGRLRSAEERLKRIEQEHEITREIANLALGVEVVAFIIGIIVILVLRFKA